MKWLKKVLGLSEKEEKPVTMADRGRTKPSTPRKHDIGSPLIIPRDEHQISRKFISDGALKVIARLRAAGFQGYLVGGSVRDLLLGKHPKDFDIATDAKPEQIRELFRNSRIIGRRFKIVHVRFGPEIIEVTTFRGAHAQFTADTDDEQANTPGSMRSESGMLLRDNVYGTLEEDAIRRDFTVNALYYTTENFAVYDYAGGLKDLRSKSIRIIGDAETRYREDPVRMLRAVRFAAKLDFSIEQNTAEPISRLAGLLRDIPAARMFDEIIKLLMGGYGEATYRLMDDYGLFEVLFPATTEAIDLGLPCADELIMEALANTDQRIADGKPVTPAFIYAALLWPALQQEMNLLSTQGLSEQLALQQAIQTTIDRQQHHTSIPRRFSQPMREIWELQWRLPRRDSRRIQNLLDHPRLRAGYDFLLLRERVGESTSEVGQWWTEFLDADEDQRSHLLRQVAAPRGTDGRRRRTRKPRS
ncbi:MAG TPA: polynucleotide adenylyltransferase PcnB [Spongiibacteraceae bacterium]|nr:polynucleotide adenylyltransferase PcnB [Spongiibacteraceae bacterium]